MTKNIYVYANQKESSQALYTQLIEYIKQSSLTLVDEKDPKDYIITIGGDGTLLSTFHRHKHELGQVRFLGIHTGHLGFYTDWQAFELKELVAGLERANCESISYPLLEVKIEHRDGSYDRHLALNEFTLRKHTSTLVVDLRVKDHFFETIRGDGVCISTPTGSTGLNKSLGGAVMHPRLDAIQLVEIASINNRLYRSLDSPMIIPSTEWFTLCPHLDQEVPLVVTVDNLNYSYHTIKSIQARLAKERISFASIKHMHFWDRVENAFIGNRK